MHLCGRERNGRGLLLDLRLLKIRLGRLRLHLGQQLVGLARLLLEDRLQLGELDLHLRDRRVRLAQLDHAAFEPLACGAHLDALGAQHARVEREQLEERLWRHVPAGKWTGRRGEHLHARGPSSSRNDLGVTYERRRCSSKKTFAISRT